MEEDGDGDIISRPFPCHISRDVYLGDCAAEPCLVLHEPVPTCDRWGREDGATLSYGPASPSDGLASSSHLFSPLVKQFEMGREDAATSAGSRAKRGAQHHGCCSFSFLFLAWFLDFHPTSTSCPNQQENLFISITGGASAFQSWGIVGHLRLITW